MKITRACVVLLLVSAAACTEDPIEPMLTDTGDLQVRPAFSRLIAGQSVALDAVAFDEGGYPVFTGPLEWTSLDNDVLTVDDEGVATSALPGWGRVVVRSTDASREDTAVVAVGLELAGVDAGDDYACGWTAAGDAWCWGARFNGRDGVLGTGARPTTLTPTRVTGGLAFSDIAPGRRHTCGIADGDVYCWGFNSDFQLGTFSCAVRDFGCHTPERPLNLQGEFAHIAVGFWSSSCASGQAGLYCWGDVSSPQPVTDCMSNCQTHLHSAALVGPVTLGDAFGCALDATGRAYCWGWNDRGQLGSDIPPQSCLDAACVRSSEPIAVTTSERFVDVTAGREFACGLTAAGQAFCWGSYSPYVEVIVPGAVPVAIGGSLRFQSIDAGDYHVCAITSAGELYCWGYEDFSGALGLPLLEGNELVEQPRRVGDGLTFTSVGAGYRVTCAISTDGGALCLGGGAGTGQGSVRMLVSPVPIVPPGAIPDWL